ncbi:MAG: FmdB family zinc ribbon protein [Tepidiformaceae bacterium]
MPIYEYYCPSCRQRFEKMRPISQATAAATCERGHPADRAISTFAMGKGGVQMMEMPAGGGCCGGGACGCSN